MPKYFIKAILSNVTAMTSTSHLGGKQSFTKLSRGELYRALEENLGYFSKQSVAVLRPAGEKLVECLRLFSTHVELPCARGDYLMVTYASSGDLTLARISAEGERRRTMHSIHSRKDPCAEAKRKLAGLRYRRESTSLFLIGSDLFYVLRKWHEVEGGSVDPGSLSPRLWIFAREVEILLAGILFLRLRSLDFFQRLGSEIEVFFPAADYDEVKGDLLSRGEARLLGNVGSLGEFSKRIHFFSRWSMLETGENMKGLGGLLRGTIEKKIRESIAGFTRGMLTRYIFEKLWLRNILANMGQAHRLIPLSQYRGVYKGKQAVLIGAGPSLDRSGNELQELVASRERGKGKGKGKGVEGEESKGAKTGPLTGPLIVALDSALPSLWDLGIVPDYIIALDAGYYNVLDFFYRPVPQELAAAAAATILVTHVSVHPLILRHFSGRIIYFHDKNSSSCGEVARDSLAASLLGFLKLEEFLEISESHLPTYGSVLHSGISVLHYFGCEDIVMVGVDLGCPGLRSHTAFSAHYQVLLDGCDRMHSLTSEAYRHLHPLLARRSEVVFGDAKGPGVDDQGKNGRTSSRVWRTQALLHYGQELSALIEELSQHRLLKCYTVSRHTPDLAGVTWIASLSEVIAMDLGDPAPVFEALKETETRKSGKDKRLIAGKVEAAMEELRGVLDRVNVWVAAGLEDATPRSRLGEFGVGLGFLDSLLGTYAALIGMQGAGVVRERLLAEELRRILQLSLVTLDRLVFETEELA